MLLPRKPRRGSLFVGGGGGVLPLQKVGGKRQTAVAKMSDLGKCIWWEMLANVARKKGFLVESFPNVTLTSQSAKISRVAKQRKIMLKNNWFPYRLHRRQSLLWVAEK